MKGLEFQVINVGHMWNDKLWNVALHNTASKSNPKLESVFWRVPMTCVLVNHPQAGYLLYDMGAYTTALNSRTPWQQEHFPVEIENNEFIDERLKELGLGVGDISGLICSHMHWDHFDGIEFFVGTKAIKNVYTQTAELQDALLYTHGGSNYNPDDPVFSRRCLDLPGIKYRFVDEDTELFPGVQLLAVHGHTAGGLIMVLECEEGSYIFTGDEIFTAENYGPPIKFPGFMKDPAAFIATVERLRKLQKKLDAKIFYSHDPYQPENVKLSPYVYR